MKNLQKRFIKLKKQGYTYEQIGKLYHISRQRVHQIVNYNFQREEAPMPVIHQIVYPNIKRWLVENDTTPKELSKIADIPYYTLYCTLVGKTHQPQPKTIIKISQATGLDRKELLKKQSYPIDKSD